MHRSAKTVLRAGVTALGLLALVAGGARAQLKPDGNIFFSNLVGQPGQTLAQQFLTLSPATGACPIGYDASVLGTVSFTHNRYADPGISGALYQPNVLPNWKPNGAAAAGGAVVVPNDGFFEQTCYIGAIDPAGTDWTLGWTYYDSTGANRQDIHLAGMPNPRPLAIYNNVSILSSSQYFGPDSNYLVVGQLRIKDQAHLTVAPGVVIFEDKPSVGTIVVERGGRIHAVGTACDPIIITSAQAPGSMAHGDCGGIYLLGRARADVPPANVCAGDSAVAEGGFVGYYGGNNDLDGSGQLRYVRVEYAGKERSPNNELNSFTFCAVGKNTRVDYCEAFEGDDDSFEWFGGSMDARHLIGVGGHDDGYDIQMGARNRAQFCIFRQSPGYSQSGGQNGDHGLEADNTETAPYDQLVCSGRSHIELANFTFIGDQRVDDGTQFPGPTFGAHWRRGVSYTLLNSIMAYFKTGGIGVEHDATWNAHCAAIPANGVLFCSATAAVGEQVSSGNVFLVRGQPNPFRNQVSLSFTLPQEGPVSVEIYSADGRLVQSLAQGRMSAGPHNVNWSLDHEVPSGMYFYRVITDHGQGSGKIARVN